jgi:hypothetical protein
MEVYMEFPKEGVADEGVMGINMQPSFPTGVVMDKVIV